MRQERGNRSKDDFVYLTDEGFLIKAGNSPNPPTNFVIIKYKLYDQNAWLSLDRYKFSIRVDHLAGQWQVILYPYIALDTWLSLRQFDKEGDANSFGEWVVRCFYDERVRLIDCENETTLGLNELLGIKNGNE